MRHLSFVCNSFRFSYWFTFWKYLFLTTNRRISIFKQLLADFFKVPYEQIYLFAAGRMGLYTALKAMQLSNKDEVVVCGYTCVVVTNAVKYTGASIVYVDIDENTLNINYDKLIAAINERTKVLIIPHNYGIVDESIVVIKKQFPALIVIEDAAHTFGSENVQGIKAGLLGDASFFSFEYSKPITTGMGGCLIVNNPYLKEKVDKIYQEIESFPTKLALKILITLWLHYVTELPFMYRFKGFFFAVFKKLGMLFKTSDKELMGEIPDYYPARLPSILAIFGILQLKDIDKINKTKKQIVKEYEALFKNIEKIKLYNHERYIMVRFPILFDSKISEKSVNLIKQRLKQKKIYVGEWFNDVVHPKGSFRYGYQNGSCRIGEGVTMRIINLPVNVSNKVNKRILYTIKQIIEQEFHAE